MKSEHKNTSKSIIDYYLSSQDFYFGVESTLVVDLKLFEIVTFGILLIVWKLSLYKFFFDDISQINNLETQSENGVHHVHHVQIQPKLTNA